MGRPLMTTLQEWQEKLNSDFPRGAMVSRVGWNDLRTGFPEFFLTTALTVWRTDLGGRPVMLFWDVDQEKDFEVTILTYTQTSETPLRVRVQTPDDKSWIFSSTIPDSLATPSWMRQHVEEQAMAMRGGV